MTKTKLFVNLTIISAAMTGVVVSFADDAKNKDATPEKTKGCYAIMYEHDDYTRGKIRFGGPVDVPRLDAYALDNGKSAGDEIDSLVTGPSAWLEVYEDENYDDTVRRFGPGSKIKKLDDDDIGDNIDSFRLYDKKPEGWVD